MFNNCGNGGNGCENPTIINYDSAPNPTPTDTIQKLNADTFNALTDSSIISARILEFLTGMTPSEDSPSKIMCFIDAEQANLCIAEKVREILRGIAEALGV